MNLLKSFSFLIFFTCSVSAAISQPVEQYVKVVIAPDHADWIYKVGEPVKFNINVLKDGNPIQNVTVKYEVGPEKMDPVKKDSLKLKDGKLVVDALGMKTPGFLRCTVTAFVNGKEYKYWSTAAFDPLSITPTVDNPSDFDSFWDSAKNELKKIPIDSRMVLLPEKCTDLVNVYHVSFQNINNSRMYGILCVPKKPGKYPALLRVPGAGIRPYNGDIKNASKGIITLEIGIHGIPVNLAPDVYTSLASGSLNGYPYFNLDNRDRYYYKRVFMGCIRANDFIDSLPEFDGKNLAVTGGSQGGALSIVTASMDPRVKFLAAFVPAMCDMTGYLKNRAGGWPHLFDKSNQQYNNKKDKIETIAYYDVVNFARRLKAPGFYSWGFNDNVCPPTSMYAAYNVIKSPKTLMLAVETAHWMYPEQTENSEDLLIKTLKGESK